MLPEKLLPSVNSVATSPFVVSSDSGRQQCFRHYLPDFSSSQPHKSGHHSTVCSERKRGCFIQTILYIRFETSSPSIFQYHSKKPARLRFISLQRDFQRSSFRWYHQLVSSTSLRSSPAGTDLRIKQCLSFVHHSRFKVQEGAPKFLYIYTGQTASESPAVADFGCQNRPGKLAYSADCRVKIAQSLRINISNKLQLSAHSCWARSLHVIIHIIRFAIFLFPQTYQ